MPCLKTLFLNKNQNTMPSINFSTHFGDKAKTPTYFIEQLMNADLPWQGEATIHREEALVKAPLIEGKKIHTIRKGKRFTQGDLCHIFTGLRTRNTKKYGVIECGGAQHIVISFGDATALQAENKKVDPELVEVNVLVEGRALSQDEIETLARNDGLKIGEFKRWFWKSTNRGVENFVGQIIHLTSLKY